MLTAVISRQTSGWRRLVVTASLLMQTTETGCAVYLAADVCDICCSLYDKNLAVLKCDMRIKSEKTFLMIHLIKLKQSASLTAHTKLETL